MNAILLNFLLTAAEHFVAALIGSGLSGQIQTLVAAEVNTDKTGAEKKQAVTDGLNALTGDLKTALSSTASWALNLGIEVAVAKVNIAAGVTATVTPPAAT